MTDLVEFYKPLDTIWILSDRPFPANHLTSSEEQQQVEQLVTYNEEDVGAVVASL